MDFEILHIEQQSPEWHELRKEKIGASDAPVIMKESPFKTPLQLWEEKMFGFEKPSNDRMRRGQTLEPEAREWVNNKLKASYEPAVIQCKENPDLIASLDGLFEADGKWNLLEIKCPGAQDHLKAISGYIPKHYIPQLQHQMHVAGVNHMYYFSFDGEGGVLILAEKDPKFCEKMVKEELLFVDRLKSFSPPEPTDRDWVDICDPDTTLKAERRRELSSLIDELSTERDEIDDYFKATLTHKRCRIGDLKAQQIVRKGTIAYDKIEILKQVDLEAYRKAPTSYWRIW